MQQVEQENPRIPELTRAQRLRRWAFTHALDAATPRNVEQVDGGFQRFNELLDQGYGMIVVIPHFSYRDFNTVLNELEHSSPRAARGPLVIPVAQHQYHSFHLEQFGRLTTTNFAPITTRDTKEREAKLNEAEKPIPWAVHDEGYGGLAYMAKAEDALGKAGVVLMSPQASRMPYLQPFEGRLRLLLRKTQEHPKIGIAIAGIEIEGVEDYSKEKIGGFNPRKIYKILFADVNTREELIASAQEHGLSVDMEVLRRMNILAPEPYKARGADGTLIFQAE